MARRGARPSLRSLRSRFEAQGFVVLEPWLRPSELALMRRECDAVVAAAAAQAGVGRACDDGAPWEARQRGCVFELPAACGAEHARDAAAFRVRPLSLTSRGRAASRQRSSRAAPPPDTQAKRGDAACRLLFGARMRRLATALLRPARRSRSEPASHPGVDDGSSSLCLFNEQFIVKPPHSGAAAAFDWHRDGAWCYAQVRRLACTGLRLL